MIYGKEKGWRRQEGGGGPGTAPWSPLLAPGVVSTWGVPAVGALAAVLRRFSLQWFAPCLSPVGCCSKMASAGWLRNNGNLLHTVLETREAEIRTPADWVFGGALLSGS